MSNPIQSRQLPSFRESSAQRSVRDADALGRQWIRHAETNAQVFSTTRSIEAIQRQLSNLKRRFGSTEQTTTYFPFQILQSPSSPALGYDPLNPTWGADPDAGWRAFRVRAGAIGRTNCTGTDGADDCPDDPSVNPTASYLDEAMDDEAPIDFVVPENLAAYYVYIDTTTTIPGVTWDANPPTVDAGVDPWMCGHYILIATIDTQTQLSAQKAIVRQYVRSDILEYYKQAVCDNYNNASLVALPGRKTT